ncbi:membrane protein insertion efficiency factor YidD [Gordonia sp. NPDC003950]
MTRPVTTDSPAADGVVDDAAEVGLSTRCLRALHLLPRRTVIFLIELYRTWVSPLRLPTCRFEPTCSGYAVEALSMHGFFHGGALALIRLCKCGPWHKPGYDPVPERGFRHRPPSPEETSEAGQPGGDPPDDEGQTSNRTADDGVGASTRSEG